MAKRMTARKKQALEMKARIQNAALDLFDREGFDHVSVEEIAQAAGCSVGNIYHYFRGKDELAIQVTSHVDEAYLDLYSTYQNSTLSPAEKLLDFVGQSLVLSSQEEVLYKSFIHSLKYPEQGVLKLDKPRAYFQVLRSLILECQSEGSISPDWDAEDLLFQLVTLHRGMLLQWRIEEGAFDIALSGQNMARRLLRLP